MPNGLMKPTDVSIAHDLIISLFKPEQFTATEAQSSRSSIFKKLYKDGLLTSANISRIISWLIFCCYVTSESRWQTF
jgi:hypothetical protein